jgi:hypothetical protein
MALPGSGSISIAQIATEIGVSLPLDINATNVRQLAGVASGNIVMPTDFYGKSWAPVCALTVGDMEGYATTDGTSPGSPQDTDSISVTAGVGGFTYQWHKTGAASIVGSSTGTTLTLRYQSTSSEEASGTYYCTVTGANGVSANSNVGNYTLVVELI